MKRRIKGYMYQKPALKYIPSAGAHDSTPGLLGADGKQICAVCKKRLIMTKGAK